MPFPLSDHNRESVELNFRKRKKSGDFTWTEDFFIKVLQTSQDKYDLNYAAQGLRAVGTMRAVPFLKAQAYFPNNDVRAVALLTVAHIARAAESDWYAELLLDPKFRMKDYAIWAIQEAGDDRALAAVVAFILKQRRSIVGGKHDPFLIAMERDYLQRMSETTSEAAQLLDDAWMKLPEDERQNQLARIAHYRTQA